MHSELLHSYCILNDTESASWVLDTFNDIDLLYREGAIINSIVVNNNTHLLQAALDYFENKQFLDKESKKYEEANQKLVEILEEASEWVCTSPDTNAIIFKYLGVDIARLEDVSEADDLAPSRQHSSEHGASLTDDILKIHNQQNSGTTIAPISRSYTSEDIEDVTAVGRASSVHTSDEAQ